MRNIRIFLIVAMFSLFMACSSETATKKKYSTNTNKTTNANVATPTPAPEKGSTLVLTGTSESKTIPCFGRVVEIDEEATATSYTLTGECKSVSVDGVSNKVYVDKIGEIKVVGTSNSVYYGEGLDGKKPKISKKGTSLTVEKKKETSDKKDGGK